MANETSRPELFARKASGLVREFGFFDAFLLMLLVTHWDWYLPSHPFLPERCFPGQTFMLC